MRYFTLVTACTPNYVDKLKWSLPSWNIKPQFRDKKLILFHNGFDNLRPLKFVKNHFDVKFIPWDMPEYDNVRELMLSSFILGSAKHVKTRYFVKIDADAYFTNPDNIFERRDFKHDAVSHRWGYTKPGYWVNDLDMYYLKKDTGKYGNCYREPRIQSIVCLHKTEFVKTLAKEFGERLPVPSHDTVLWYFADRMPDRSWKSKNIKRRGVGHSQRWKTIRENVCATGDPDNKSLKESLMNNIQLEVTSFCQLGCFNCDRNCGIYKDTSFISIDKIKKFVDESIQNNKKWSRIDIIGGEPTFYPYFKEMFEAIKVYKDFYPRCKIRFSTNGLGKHVQEKLKEIPFWVDIRNSNKKSKVQAFESYNSAPVDNGETEFKACSIPWRCGIALTSNGYFLCGAGASVSKIFQMGIGIHNFEEVTPENLLKQITSLCKYCGHSNCKSKHLTKVEDISESWKEALNKLKGD